MAREKKPRREKSSNGMFAQFREGIRFLKAENPRAVPLAIASGVIAFLVIAVVGAFISGGTYLGVALYIVIGIATGYLTALLVISRSTNTAVFNKYADEPGRVGLVVGVLTRRSYKGSNQPVAVNPKTKDTVFRIVGPAGVVLLGDGGRASTQSLMEDERRKIQRVVQGVTVHMIYCSTSGDGVPLKKLESAVKKLKRTLNRNEIRAVQNRLSAIDTRFKMPIPKGIDPMKIRPSRKMR